MASDRAEYPRKYKEVNWKRGRRTILPQTTLFERPRRLSSRRESQVPIGKVNLVVLPHDRGGGSPLLLRKGQHLQARWGATRADRLPLFEMARALQFDLAPS